MMEMVLQDHLKMGYSCSSIPSEKWARHISAIIFQNSLEPSVFSTTFIVLSNTFMPHLIGLSYLNKSFTMYNIL